MIAGRYELEREIGRGGMGAVWLAQDTVLGRPVAIKRIGLAPGGGTPDLDRAEREARLAARLNHTHVVHVFDLVTDDDGEWLVMEYVDGRTLSELVRADGPLSHDDAARLLGQTADALTAAHTAGIVHRDVKPSNILVAPTGEVKLSDFGIARAEADTTLTQTGLVTGSPAYLSPEVASGQAATPASDVWSLGASLYHALSGRPPYEVGDNLMGALYKIVHEEPPRLPDARWLAPVLAATMTRDPGDRWSMEQVRDFLAAGPRGATSPIPPTDPEATRAMTPPPVVLPPTSPATATQAPVEAVEPEPGPERRRRSWLPLAAVAAVVAVVGLVAWALLTGDPGETPTIDRPRADDQSSRSQQENDGSTSGSPSDTGSQEQPTARGMERFIGNYLATAPSSPETTFEMLTPAFQRESGGFGGYSGYWGTISSADLVEVQADPENLVVDYVVAYVREDGSEVTDDVRLQLEYRDGKYFIADEA